MDLIDRLRKLCGERKYSVMVDNDGRMEDAVLSVDVLRIVGEPSETVVYDPEFDY